jgi:hypothetical protein
MGWVRGKLGDLVHFSFIILVKDKIDSHGSRSSVRSAILATALCTEPTALSGWSVSQIAVSGSLPCS